MGLFDRKQKVSLDGFSRDFYSRNILTGVTDDSDVPPPAKTYLRGVSSTVVEADGELATIDDDSFLEEVTLIHFEVFGLAWMHQQGDKLAAAQSAFTKRYLESYDRADIWDDLLPYNQAIARSVLFSQTRVGTACTLLANERRVDLFKRGSAQGFDEDAVARAANRICTEEAWEKGRTPILLMCTLCEHLDCDVRRCNEPEQLCLIAAISALYGAAGEALTRVRIVESPPG